LLVATLLLVCYFEFSLQFNCCFDGTLTVIRCHCRITEKYYEIIYKIILNDFCQTRTSNGRLRTVEAYKLYVKYCYHIFWSVTSLDTSGLIRNTLCSKARIEQGSHRTWRIDKTGETINQMGDMKVEFFVCCSNVLSFIFLCRSLGTVFKYVLNMIQLKRENSM